MPQDYIAICEYIYHICAIQLAAGKEYLVEQRLEPVAKANGCENFAEFANLIAFKYQDPQLREQVIGAITTNETSFFRDTHPFELFKSQILPWLCDRVKESKGQLVQWGGPKVRILCAGASTGQEPYSLSMILQERLTNYHDPQVTPADFKIVGADISTPVLEKAKTGRYTDLEMGRGLSSYQQQLYFEQNGTDWQLKTPIKSIVEFERVNFALPFKHLGHFDAVFCRNMLIYFDEKTRKGIVTQLFDMLVPGGFLVIGATENLNFCDCGFVSSFMEGGILYRKPECPIIR